MHVGSKRNQFQVQVVISSVVNLYMNLSCHEILEASALVGVVNMAIGVSFTAYIKRDTVLVYSGPQCSS